MPETITIPDRVRSLIAEHFCVPTERVTDDASLADDLGADSLDTIELCMAVEEEFGVEMTDDEADGWQSVGDILKTVGGKRT